MRQEFVVVLAIALLIVIISLALYTSSKSSLSSSGVTQTAPLCPTCEEVALPTTALTGGSTGAKRALLIGLNYRFMGSYCIRNGCTLNGCIDDVKNIRTFLVARGYEVTLLVDDGSTEMPNKQKIIDSLQSLVASTQPGDKGFVWYSGHGSQITNPEADGGFDECWCPPDTLANGNYLTDNTISAILRQAPQDSTIFVGSDSCHSATILDMKYIANQSDGLNSNRSIDSIRGRLAIQTIPKPKAAPIGTRVISEAAAGAKAVEMTLVGDSQYEATSATIVCISGCQDYDTSADAYENGQPQGAMTWSFLASFDANKSFADLINSMRSMLKGSGYAQVPQLTLGKLFNPNITKMSLIV